MRCAEQYGLWLRMATCRRTTGDVLGAPARSAGVAAPYPARLIRVEANRGPSTALNAGISAATGESIALLDSDGLCEPGHLQVVVELLGRYPAAAVAAGRAQAFGAGQRMKYSKVPPGEPVNVFDLALHATVFVPSTTIMRRAAIVEGSGYYEDNFYANGFDLLLRLGARYPFVPTARVTGRFRQHTSQMSNPPVRQLRSRYKMRHHRLGEIAHIRPNTPTPNLEQSTR